MDKKNSRDHLLEDVFDLINDWLNSYDIAEGLVNNYRTPTDLQEELNLSLPAKGEQRDSMLIDEVRNYLKYSVKTGHPAYLNQMFGGMNLPALIGEFITSATNTSMYTYEVAPVATLMEIKLVEKMLSYTGWKDGNGAMMTGGSNSNMVAMILARNNIFKGVKETGLGGLPKLAILVSARSHFSMLKGANATGIGQDNVVKVDLDSNGRMRGPALEAAILKTINSGRIPFMVCSTAGTTETGSFDAIDEISAIAKKYELWHHVDGAWGGSVILSTKRRHLLKGLESADSFSWNPHKLMNIPLICSVLLVKDPNVLADEIRSHDADYIYHENETSSFDLGPSSLQCGRRVDALKLWLAWKYYGDDGYANRIERLFALANFCDEYIQDHPELELTFPTQSLNVNFRYRAPSGVDPNELNERARYHLLKSGKAMVNYCRLNNQISIRLVLLNPDLTEGNLKDFFNDFIDSSKHVLSEMRVSRSL